MKSPEIPYRLLFPLSLLCVAIAWEVLPRWLEVPHYIFPPLSSVFTAIFKSLPALWQNVQVTLSEALLGFVIGSALGFLIGLAMAQSRIVTSIALPYVVASNAVPILALAPILVLTFGSGMASKVAVAAFLCFFPLSINTYKGLREYPASFHELFQIYGASKWDFLIYFKLPHAFPFLITGLKLNAVFSVVGAIVAEFIGSNKGIGYVMLQSSYNLNTPKLWGYILIACFLGMIFYGIIYIIEKLFVKHFNP